MSKSRLLSIAVLSALSLDVAAMGIRSFVALPLEKGGTVLRLLAERNTDQDVTTLNTNVAYGISHSQALFFGLPYRLSPAGRDQSGDLNVLYRHTSWQLDDMQGTSRLAFLGGGVVPTDSARDGALQVGAVATFFRKRHELDFDVLWQQGLANRLNQARYDIAWQYRLDPARHPDWGIGSEWDIDLELGGRWRESGVLVHQVTLGLQSIHERWVIEAALIQDLNGTDDTRFLLSTRLHF